MKKNTFKKITLFVGCFFIFLSASAQTNSSTKIGDWNDATVWSLGIIPTSAHDVSIGHAVTISSGTTAFAGSLHTAASPAQLIIRENASLTVTGNITQVRSNDGIYIFGQVVGNYKMGTIIFGGTNQNRTRIRQGLPQDKWHLVANPFSNALISHTTHPAAAFDNLVVNGSGKKSLAYYDDNLSAGNKYVYYNNSPTPSGNLGIAQGYSIKVNDVNPTGGTTHDFTMTGVMNDGPVSINISDAGNGFNLVGNPYISYLNANTGAHATNNLLSVNVDVLEEQTIWLWDSANSVFITKNLGDAAFRINPIQGFFLKAKLGGGTTQSLNFNKTMESHNETNAFFKTSNDKIEINLSLTNDEITRKTVVRYIENQTTDFDNGYDSSIFGGYDSGATIFTELVDNNIGKKLAIQSLPNVNYENMVIPVGVNAAAGKEIIFSAEAMNLPNGIKVFIEDRMLNTMTRLDEANATYKVTTTDALNGTGRFFIHTKSSGVLSTNDFALQGVSVYKSTEETLKVVGLSQGTANIKLFSVLGKQVMNTKFQATGTNEISLPKLAKGIYLVQLETEKGKLNKKIILE